MPSGVSRYMCRGGLPGSLGSHEVSSSFRSARRMRIGYSVPDFSGNNILAIPTAKGDDIDAPFDAAEVLHV